jgi:hypothetical protein
MKSLTLCEWARSDDKEVGMIGFHVFDDRVDDMVHLDHGGCRPAILDEVVAIGVDQPGRSFYDRLHEGGYLRGR